MRRLKRWALIATVCCLAAAQTAESTSTTPAAKFAFSRSAYRRLTQDSKCEQCQSCSCDTNCDCIDTSSSPDKCAQCQSCQCDTNCDCIDTSTPPDKCAQCQSCQCDTNCDCIDTSTPPATHTDVTVSNTSVTLGENLKPADIIREAWAVCERTGCVPERRVIKTKLRTSVRNSGDIACDGHPCGEYKPGSCTVTFEGSYEDWDKRNMLVPLLDVVANASQALASGSQPQWDCNLIPCCEDCSTQCCSGLGPPSFVSTITMPWFIQAQRWHNGNQAGYITMTLRCDLDPQPVPGWVCPASGILAGLAGLAQQPLVAAYFGIFSATCTTIKAIS